jgi:hypothetical protein
MSNRPSLIIHDLTSWAPPAQVITSERGEQFRRTGHCRICGDQECWTPEECAEEAQSLSWARCSCCSELVIAGTPCQAYLVAWCDAVEAKLANLVRSLA